MIGKNSMKHHYLNEKDFYTHLNVEERTDADYAHANVICKELETKNLEQNHDLYVQCNTLLLADVHQKFQNMCFKIHEISSCSFSYCTRFSMARSLEQKQL